MNARPVGLLRFATLFAALALLSCGKEEPPVDESLPLDLREFPWSTMVLGCGVPLNFATDKPLSSFAALESAGCDTVNISMERHRGKWEELERLGECSDGGDEPVDWRALFLDRTGRIALGFGREGRVVQLENGRRCAIPEQNVLGVCLIYNALFGTSESHLFCTLPWSERDWLRWRGMRRRTSGSLSWWNWQHSGWQELKETRRQFGDSAVTVFYIDLRALCVLYRHNVNHLVNRHYWQGRQPCPRGYQIVLSRSEADGFVERLRKAGAPAEKKWPIDYRVVAVDTRGQFVFGMGPLGWRVRIGESEYLDVPDENLPIVHEVYDEIMSRKKSIEIPPEPPPPEEAE